jgi:osmotically-inducible protein OsmY
MDAMVKMKNNTQVFIKITILLLFFSGVCIFMALDNSYIPMIKTPVPDNKSDLILAKRVRDTLLFHNNVNVAKTKIFVRDGVVTLQGEADSQAQKELTEAYADSIKGVKDVDNYMTVTSASEKPPKTIYNMIDDDSITSRIKTELFFHKSTSVFRTGVETRAGVVTLSGKVHSAAEKDLIAQLASNIEGVKKVINNMTLE